MVMEHDAKQRCIVCSEEKADGIVVVDQFICLDCEQEMVHTDVKDAKYPFFIDQLKRLWLKLHA